MYATKLFSELLKVNLIHGHTFGVTIHFQWIKHTKLCVVLSQHLHTSLGFGTPLVKQDTNFSFGFYCWTDWTQGTYLEGNNFTYLHMRVQLCNVMKKKHWYICSGPALLLKIVGIMFALIEVETCRFWKALKSSKERFTCLLQWNW
jgi:hypothetical protein